MESLRSWEIYNVEFLFTSFAYFSVESSPLLKNSKFLKREQPGGDSETLNSTEEVLFKEYLKQQIDHLMTGDAGRDGVAEGRRGTHVEVCIGVCKIDHLSTNLKSKFRYERLSKLRFLGDYC